MSGRIAKPSYMKTVTYMAAVSAGMTVGTYLKRTRRTKPDWNIISIDEFNIDEPLTDRSLMLDHFDIIHERQRNVIAHDSAG